MPFNKHVYNKKHPSRVGGHLRCDKCGRELEDGETYYSYYRQRRTRRVTIAHYCKACYDSFWWDPDRRRS